MAEQANPLQLQRRRRFGDIVDRLGFYAPYQSDPDRWAAVLSDLRAA